METIPFNIFAADPLKNPEAQGWVFPVGFPQYSARGKDRKEATKNLMNIVSNKIYDNDFIGTDTKTAKGMKLLLVAMKEAGAFETERLT